MNLSHVRVLVTRPEPQAQALTDAINEAGGHAWSMPMLGINALTETLAIKNCLLMFDQFDRIIVTSSPAARLGMDLIEQYWPQLPIHIQWFAIGASTASELEYFGVRAVFSNQGVNSEALLDLDSFIDVKGENVLIIKGWEDESYLQSNSLTQVPMFRNWKFIADSVQLINAMRW